MVKFIPYFITLTLLFSAGYGTEQSPYRIFFLSDRDRQGQGQAGGPGSFVSLFDYFLMNPNGTDQVKLTEAQRSNLWVSLSAERSPDGSKLLFMTFHPNGAADDIVLLNPDGTVQAKLTDNQWRDFDPTWSPDGSKIAFGSNRDAYAHKKGEDIFVMDADGTNQVNLTQSPDSRDVDPQWSLDGRKIVFASDRHGSWNIHIMNPDGTGQTNLTSGLDSDKHPQWFPDGSKIAFTRFYPESGPTNILAVDQDGTNLIHLTSHEGNDMRFSWSPDGSKILFDSDRDGNRDIFVMDSNGMNLVNLTGNYPGEDLGANWVAAGIIPPTNVTTNSWGQVKAGFR